MQHLQKTGGGGQDVRPSAVRRSDVQTLPTLATLSAPFGGEPHTNTRGRLDTAVRVHRFGELAQTHACCRSVCAPLGGQNWGGRRNLGTGVAAERFRFVPLAQSAALAGSCSPFVRP